ncbi:MAG: DNA cytosine methyltransferase [Planctomycetota bacterium]
MKFGSICSGIEAASVAWHPLGWQCQFVSEIEAFPCAVLNHHYPDVPNVGDMTKVAADDLPAIDVLVGGTPCQSFSVAGKRGGLDDARGSLAFRFLEIAAAAQARWFVWENVPGVLSSGGGRDFGAILGRMGQLGYGFAYRVLDAQFTGVPQRRRRVFVVGHLGDWRRAAAVLFERESLCWDSPTREAQRQDVAGTLGGGSGSRGWCDDLDRCGSLVPTLKASDGRYGSVKCDGDEAKLVCTHEVSPCLQERDSKGQDSDATKPLVFQCHGSNVGEIGALRTGNGNATGGVPFMATADPITANEARTYSNAGNNRRPRNCVTSHGRVRRLTPRECERLQGFPDDYTLIPWKKKPREKCPDGPRYRAIGNSMAVPVMRWIGERIAGVDAVSLEGAA